MIKANEEIIPNILDYLKKDVGNCLYMYLDIAKYGISNPNMDVWYEADDSENINEVVMRYHDSIQVYSKDDDCDIDGVIPIIKEYKPGMVSGKKEIIERIYTSFDDEYEEEIGYVFKLTQFRKFGDVVPIERVGRESCREIAEFICTNDEIGGYYDVNDLTEQFRERIDSGIGRNLVIKKDDKMLGTISSYVEYEGIATTAGLLAVDDGSGIPYGTILESKLINDLLDEGFEIYTFVTEDRRARFFRAMNCEEIGRYGKMTRSLCQ